MAALYLKVVRRMSIKYKILDNLFNILVIVPAWIYLGSLHREGCCMEVIVQCYLILQG